MDAAPRPDAATPDAARPDASAPDADAGASAPDADADASAPDAGADADADLDAGAPDATADAAPAPTLELVADIPGLTDFDLNQTHLLYRVGTTQLRACELPACTGDRAIITLNATYNQIAASDTKFFFFWSGVAPQQYNLTSTNLDGTGRTNENPITWNGQVLPTALVGGLTNLQPSYRLIPQLGGSPQVRTYTITSASTRVPRTAQSVVVHQNYGSLANGSNPPTVTGATLPALPGAISVIGTSPRGAGVTYPMVVVRQGGVLKACPTTTDCAAWIELGALGSWFNLDETHLYIGSGAGLGRCTLEEIALTSTCTVTPLGGEAADAQLYLTATDAWFRSGTKIYRVTK